MHPAPVRSVAMVPDLHAPQMSLAFGEQSACQRGATESGWRPDQTVLEPAKDCWSRLRPDAGATPLQTSLYPGRAVACAPCPAPLRSNRVSSSSDAAKDFSQPLFVDTTVEYDLPKAAYPPENSEPLLIVHPQYFEHLRHRRTLGDGCACQLCNFYGRRIPHGGQGESAAVPAAAPAAAAAAAAAAAVVSTSASQQTFQKPEAPRHWPRRLHQPQPQPQPAASQALHQHHLLQRHQAAQHQLAQQSAQLAAQQAQQQQQQLAQQPRYNCMLERYGPDAGAAFVTPTVSCDSDSGYSSVELEPAEWCHQRRQQQQRAERDARDVLAKRKRRADATEAADTAKRLRISYWPGGVPALDMVPYLHRQPAVM